MSHRYKFGPGEYPHFSTMTTTGWIDLFTRERYRKVMYDSWTYCIQQKGWILHAYVIMSNHVHLISSMRNGHHLHELMRDMKKYCSKALIREINHSGESRKDWLLELFSQEARKSAFQVWQPGNHPIVLDTREKLGQKLTYLHLNPVKSGIVRMAEDYVPSSAGASAGGKSIVPIEPLWVFGE